jgi:hypothetical protein
MTIVLALLRRLDTPQMVAFALLVAASAWAVILSQTTLAVRFKLEPGPWRRILAAALTAVPALLIGSGSRFFGSSSPDRAVLVYLLGMVLVDWSLRMNPRREERISLGSAFSACLPAFFLGIFFGLGGSTLIGGALLATVSLVVNGLSPFVPHDRRRKKAPARELPPAAQGAAAGAAAAAAPPAATAASPTRSRGLRRSLRRLARLDAGPPAAGERLAWHQRPVHPLVRFIDYFLGAAGIGVALVFLPVGLFGDGGIEAYTGAVISGALGTYFLRQGLRERRGKLWGGTIRPFFLIGSTATIAVCLAWICYFTWYEDRPWDREPIWMLATLALVTGVLAYVLRPWSRARAQPPAEPAAPPERTVHLGWAALGVLLWMAGLASALVACAATVGLGEALDLQRELGVGSRFMEFLPGAAWSLTLNVVIAAAACIVVSRRRAGNLHILRAIGGQAALGFLLFLAFQIAQTVRVARGGGVEYWGSEESLFFGAAAMLGLAAGGVVLLAWPIKRARSEPFPEVSHG